MRLAAGLPWLRRKKRRVCYVLSGMHLLIILAAVLLIQTNRPGVDAADLLVAVPQWAWLPVPLALALLCGLARLWPVSVINGLALLEAGLILGGFSLGAVQAHPAPTGNTVRIMTWNVHNRYTRVDAIRHRILACDPDVVCLQEASNRNFIALLPGYAEMSSTSLRMYSRLRLEKWPQPDLTAPAFQRWLPGTVYLPGGKPLHVLNIHLHSAAGGHMLLKGDVRPRIYLEWRERLQQEQSRQIGAVTRGVGPVLACGDVNAPPNAPFHRALRGVLTDAFSSRGLGFGMTYLFRSPLPLWRLDYIWCGDGASATRCVTGSAYPSDHRPVIADIVVPPGVGGSG